MEKIVAMLALAFVIFSCDNGGMGETGPYSLVGTWEASGEIVVEGDQRTYKSTLVFVSETEYTQTTHYKSKQGVFDLTVENKGTYVREDEQIIYTDTYRTSSNAPFEGPNVYRKPYKFTNKNTLETYGPGISNLYISSMVYKRK